MSFPKDFIWGAAAASYQVEGAAYEDGKGLSVWDMLCRQPGRIWSNDTGEVACDHYHRYEQDARLMAEIGLKAYRLSISWPRVIPDGTGKVNAKGLAFYDKLVDSLLENGVDPWVTLFHWDYPYALYCRGGWLNRDSSDWFAEYTQVIVDKLSDRVTRWMTQNEPQCFIGLGHQEGEHAPGLKLGFADVLLAAHNSLLAHGKAVHVIRARTKRKALIGAAPVGIIKMPCSGNPEDVAAARAATFSVTAKNCWNNTWFADPVVLGNYPADGLKLFEKEMPVIREGDMATIRQPWQWAVLLAFLAAGHGVNESYNAGVREVNQAEFADSCAPESVGGNIVGPPWGGKYDFKNDSGENGSYTIVRGTAASVNSVFIQMAKAVDQCDIKKLAESIGVHNGNPDQELITRPSCSIGGCENAIAPLQQAAAYAAIANQGIFCEPRMVDKVIVIETGEVLEGEPSKCGQSLVSPGVANTAAYAMQAVMNGTGSQSNPRDGTPYIGKTGTTDKSIHTWMVGSSTQVATAVWVGNVQGDQAMRNIRINGQSGGLLRHRIFQPLAQAIDSIYPGGAFPGPDPALLTGSPVEVPNLIGASLEQANAALTLAELGFEDGGQVDSDLPAGQVASTDPGPGAQVSRGTTVRVFTSNGLAKPVPNVVGMSSNAARSALESPGFSVNEVCYDPSDVAEYPTTPPPDDTVMSQDPPAGTYRNPAATTVTITYYRTTPGAC